MEVGARDVQGLPLFAQLAPRQSYASMGGGGGREMGVEQMT